MLEQFRNANTGAGQDFTGLSAAVQLRLRVAIGLQTLTVKPRLLTGEKCLRTAIKCESVATRQFRNGVMDGWIVGLLGCRATRFVSPSIQLSTTPLIHFFMLPQLKLSECDASNVAVAGASPATRTILECQPAKRAGPRC